MQLKIPNTSPLTTALLSTVLGQKVHNAEEQYFCCVVHPNAERKPNDLDFSIVFHNEKSLQMSLNLLDNVAQ